MRFTDILTSSAHAYIVEAGAGENRDRFVRDFVKGLNCECPDIGARPCNSCPSCRQIEAGTSMDVIHMEKSGKNAYKVEDAAALTERLGMGSYGRHIVGVVDEADLLSETIQNKLLKTLEEPEEGAIIILATANRDNLLRTVRSRCNAIRVSDYAGYESDEAEAVNENITETAAIFINSARRMTGDRTARRTPFHECRTAIDKKIKTQEEAIELLGVIEDACGEQHIADAIDRIETARMDIYRGMQYGKALRRLYLELA